MGDDITVRMALLLLLLISSITLQATQAKANTLGLEDNLLWEKFKLQHMKAYPHREEEVRQGVFRANLRKIAAHNEREEQGLETWRMAVTEFADLTEEEFTQQVLGGYVRTPQSLGGRAKREAASDLPALTLATICSKWQPLLESAQPTSPRLTSTSLTGLSLPVATPE